MSEAKWKLLVDWQGDGRFTGANDDITDATLQLSLRHMRDLKTEYIDAARLDIRLANSDHKYSPPKARSPLFGSLKPGRKVWLRAAFPCDEFGGTPGASLADHAPEYGSIYRWTTPNRDFRITANGGAQTSGSHTGKRIATMDFGLADVSFGCELTRGSDTNSHAGLTLRYKDANNFLYLRATGSALQLRKVERGADTLIAQSALQWSAGIRRFIQGRRCDRRARKSRSSTPPSRTFQLATTNSPGLVQTGDNASDMVDAWQHGRVSDATSAQRATGLTHGHLPASR